jgi:hypothetical protein
VWERRAGELAASLQQHATNRNNTVLNTLVVEAFNALLKKYGKRVGRKSVARRILFRFER